MKNNFHAKPNKVVTCERYLVSNIQKEPNGLSDRFFTRSVFFSGNKLHFIMNDVRTFLSRDCMTVLNVLLCVY